jgi:hypothetical protein
MATNPTGPSETSALFQLLKDNNLLEEFTKRANLSTSESILPSKEVRNVDSESVKPKLTTGVIVDTSRKSTDQTSKSDLDAKTGFTPGSASDMLSPYAGMSIYYAMRKTPSSYVPSSLMMFYIVHLMNSLLVDSHYFRRACPDFHPYVFRLYCGILFWIQCTRVGVFTNTLSVTAHQFLSGFLESHPLATLPVPSPLMMVFKSLCASQPEITEYGYVYPTVACSPGPNRRDAIIKDDITSFTLPNVPGIFALLEHLNTLLSATPPTIPLKGSHTTVAATGVTFGHHAFNAEATRTPLDKWMLVSPGLEYPCEADKKMNEAFTERYSSFNFPTHAETDNISQLVDFLSLRRRTDWFARVKEVAAVVSGFFQGSGTLADCPTFGYSANQVVIEYSATEAVLPTPTAMASPASLFPFSFRAKTSARKLAPATLAMACSAQTNVRMPPNHPYLSNFGVVGHTLNGQFWSIVPEEYSERSDEAFLNFLSIIRGLFSEKKIQP